MGLMGSVILQVTSIFSVDLGKSPAILVTQSIHSWLVTLM